MRLDQIAVNRMLAYQVFRRMTTGLAATALITGTALAQSTATPPCAAAGAKATAKRMTELSL